MKKTIPSFAILLLLYSCNQSAPSSTAGIDSTNASAGDRQSKVKRNKAVIRASLNAYAKGNVDEMLKNADPNIIDYGDGFIGTIKGADSLRAMMKTMMVQWMAAIPETKFTDTVIVVSGDTVLNWASMPGTWKGEFMKQKPTGKSFRINRVNRFVLNEEGKIIEHRSTPSDLDIAKQIGTKM